MAGIVVVFDFDKTIIDCDSDNWVIDELGATELFNQLLPTMPWNSLMDRMMKELHDLGKTIEDITEVLKRTPIHPRNIPAIKSAHDLGCDLKIVSDANTFFIETFLKHHGIWELFSEIHTNPSFVDDEGRLRIFPHHDFTNTKSPLDCNTNLCPPNMCKAMVIEKIQACNTDKKFIYLGDGIGDFCPSLKLKNGDYLMPRKNFPVWDLICKNQKLIKAEIHQWSDGQEMEHVLIRLIKAISTEETNNGDSTQIVSVKLQTIPVTAH
ncbi:inorganic pyrophosphatase 1-like [Pistacia vera]|uniref:inorganic pyrophosphatase 1-like n=1 Tax=Pistacia vera TaxID=55513 RepID=UPI001262C6A1|nr:inorganic pyrophosphatase 1-like [Pistacia vera]